MRGRELKKHLEQKRKENQNYEKIIFKWELKKYFQGV